MNNRKRYITKNKYKNNPYFGLSKTQLLNMEIDRTEKIIERIGESPRLLKYLQDLNNSKMLLHEKSFTYLGHNLATDSTKTGAVTASPQEEKQPL